MRWRKQRSQVLWPIQEGPHLRPQSFLPVCRIAQRLTRRRFYTIWGRSCDRRFCDSNCFRSYRQPIGPTEIFYPLEYWSRSSHPLLHCPHWNIQNIRLLTNSVYQENLSPARGERDPLNNMNNMIPPIETWICPRFERRNCFGAHAWTLTSKSDPIRCAIGPRMGSFCRSSKNRTGYL